MHTDRHFIIVIKITCLFSYRLNKLLETIMGQSQNKTIIFVETKKKVDEITRKLRYAG